MCFSDFPSSASSGYRPNTPAKILFPFLDDTRPIDDHADPVCADDVISDDEVGLADFQTRTLAVEILLRYPDDLLATPDLVFGHLEDFQHVDRQLGPVADGFARVNARLDRCTVTISNRIY